MLGKRDDDTLHQLDFIYVEDQRGAGELAEKNGRPHPKVGTVIASADGIVPVVHFPWRRMRINLLVL